MAHGVLGVQPPFFSSFIDTYYNLDRSGDTWGDTIRKVICIALTVISCGLFALPLLGFHKLTRDWQQDPPQFRGPPPAEFFGAAGPPQQPYFPPAPPAHAYAPFAPPRVPSYFGPGARHMPRGMTDAPPELSGAAAPPPHPRGGAVTFVSTGLPAEHTRHVAAPPTGARFSRLSGSPLAALGGGQLSGAAPGSPQDHDDLVGRAVARREGGGSHHHVGSSS